MLFSMYFRIFWLCVWIAIALVVVNASLSAWNNYYYDATVYTIEEEEFHSVNESLPVAFAVCFTEESLNESYNKRQDSK